MHIFDFGTQKDPAYLPGVRSLENLMLDTICRSVAIQSLGSTSGTVMVKVFMTTNGEVEMQLLTESDWLKESELKPSNG